MFARVELRVRGGEEVFHATDGSVRQLCDARVVASPVQRPLHAPHALPALLDVPPDLRGRRLARAFPENLLHSAHQVVPPARVGELKAQLQPLAVQPADLRAALQVRQHRGAPREDRGATAPRRDAESSRLGAEIRERRRSERRRTSEGRTRDRSWSRDRRPSLGPPKEEGRTRRDLASAERDPRS